MLHAGSKGDAHKQKPDGIPGQRTFHYDVNTELWEPKGKTGLLFGNIKIPGESRFASKDCGRN